MSTDIGITFKSTRNKWNKYVFFTVIYNDDDMLELDCDKLLDHDVHEGMIYLSYEDNHKRVIKEWAMMEYALNNPQ